MFSSAFSIGASGLRSAQYQIDVVADNLANANTPGFRRTDTANQNQQYGGVSTVFNHRFSSAAATRLSQISGEVAFSETSAESLRTLERPLSDASRQIGDAMNSFNQALTTLALSPSEPAAQEMAQAQGKAVATLGSNLMQELASQAAMLDGEMTDVQAQANTKIKQLNDLNQLVINTGETPALKNQMAKIGEELSALVGGEITFNPAGTTTFTVNGKKIVNAGAEGEPLPDAVGGKLGALASVKETLSGYQAEVSSSFSSFVDSINTANGQDLFSITDNKLQFVGTAADISAANADETAKIPQVALTLGNIAIKAASSFQTAQVAAQANGAIYDNASSAQRQQEGVNVDAESIKLKKAQRLYEINAKVIQTADAMMNVLVNLKA